MSENQRASEGVRISWPEDCGNAPKKVLIRDFEIAMAQNEVPVILESLTGDCVWKIVGEWEYQGIENVRSAIKEESGGRLLALQIETILTHGNTGAANGILEFAGRKLAFCNIYHFNSAKNARIKQITSYRIPLP